MKKFSAIICLLLIVLVGFSFAGCMQDGQNGKSAYELAKENGFNGTESEWLLSLKGQDGKDGTNGVDGKDGINGVDGQDGQDGQDGTNGVDGKDGTNGTNGKSAYEIAKDNGFEGTESEWLLSLKGQDGKDGTNGVDGKDGIDGIDGVDGKDGVNGTNGKDGTNGTNGKSAYEIAKDNGFEGTESEWLDSLVGEGASSGPLSYNNAVNNALLSSVAIISDFTKSVSGTLTSYQTASSGVIIKDNKTTGEAYILTNYHVIYESEDIDNMADKISCFLYGQYLYASYAMTATFVGGSMKYDVVVLKIQSDIYKESIAKPITLKNSDEVNISDNVVVVGNALGYGFSATAGIVTVPSMSYSNKQPNGVTYQNRLLRVDSVVNSGNSGGGAFDINGNFIGLVKAKIVKEGIEGIGLIIPSNVAYRLAENIIENCNGETSKQAKIVDLKFSVGLSSSMMKKDENGNVQIYETVYVTSIESSSIFYNKLQQNDVIKSITVNNIVYEITRNFQIEEIVFNLKIGDQIKINVTRSGISKNFTATFNSATTID